MKIVLVHGQNHKGSTYHIGRMLADKIDSEKEIQEFFLPRDLNHFCVGCYRCIEGDANCPFYEEKRRITDALEAADLMIFTTPNYCFAPSAPLKSFIDLTFTYWMSHRPRACMFRKRAVVISTAAGAGTGIVIKPVARTLFFWGVPSIRRYGIGVQAMNWAGVKPEKKAKIERDMTKLARKLSRTKPPMVGLKTRFVFQMMANLQKSGWGSSPFEKQYWSERGWLDKKRPWQQES